MAETLVIRGRGDKRDDDIVELILADERARVERGRNHIDENTRYSTNVLTGPYTYAELGQLIEIRDCTTGGDIYRAKVTGVRHTISRATPRTPPVVKTTLTVRRPLACVD